MLRSLLLTSMVLALGSGCMKGGPTLDGRWSMLVTGSDVGGQEITFSGGRDWELKTEFKSGDVAYLTTAKGTYTLVDKKLTMKTVSGDVAMNGGTEAQKKAFEASRGKFLSEFEKRKDVEDVSEIKWMNDNSFEARIEGQVMTFHRK